MIRLKTLLVQILKHLMLLLAGESAILFTLLHKKIKNKINNIAVLDLGSYIRLGREPIVVLDGLVVLVDSPADLVDVSLEIAGGAKIIPINLLFNCLSFIIITNTTY